MIDRSVLALAAQRKAAESARVQRTFFDVEANTLAEVAEAIARRLVEGARIFTLGNGGSACDAQHFAIELMHPILEKRRPLPAIALHTDAGLMSAVGNDQEFSLLFSDQLRLLGRAGDVVVGFSTSGDAANVCRAFAAAREMGLYTLAIVGRDGGRLAPLSDRALVVPSYDIHRIQETHSLVLHVLWDLIQLELGAEDVS